MKNFIDSANFKEIKETVFWVLKSSSGSLLRNKRINTFQNDWKYLKVK